MDKKVIFAVMNDLMGCYDCPSQLCGIYSTKELAQEHINKYSKRDQEYFDIEEIYLDEER